MNQQQSSSNGLEEGEDFMDSALKELKKSFDDNWENILTIHSEAGHKLLKEEKQKWKMLLEFKVSGMILDIARANGTVSNGDLQGLSEAAAMSIIDLLKQQLPTFVKLEQHIKNHNN